jgi:hypothetical protein
MTESLPTRRVALTGLVGASALVFGLGATCNAGAADLDAPLFDLLERWRAACALRKAADDRFDEVDEASYVEPPAALIRTADDGLKFHLDASEIGQPFRDLRTIERLEVVISALAMVARRGDYLQEIVNRYVEVQEAFREHSAAVEAARQSAGYYEADAGRDAARAAEEKLRRAVANARPRTVSGLLAKLHAVADAFGPLHSIEEETSFDDDADVPLDGLALTVLCDCSAIMGRATA